MNYAKVTWENIRLPRPKGDAMDKPTIYTAAIVRDNVVVTFLQPEDIFGPIKFYVPAKTAPSYYSIDPDEVFQRWRKGGKEVEASFNRALVGAPEPFAFDAVSLRPGEERPICSGTCPGSE